MEQGVRWDIDCMKCLMGTPHPWHDNGTRNPVDSPTWEREVRGDYHESVDGKEKK